VFTVNAQTSATRILDVRVDYSNPTTGVWCWAGCISSIANYYGHSTTQCQVANLRRIRFNYGNVNCCSITTPFTLSDTISCVSGTYFTPSYLDEIGPILNYDFNIPYNYVSTVLSYSSIKNSIDNNRPVKIVAAHYRNNRYGYHSMIIIGYDDNGNIIHYIDPGSGIMQDTYNNITTTECMGVWDYQYGVSYPTAWVLTQSPCPTNLNLTARIGSNAIIVASNDIQCSALINNNTTVSLTAGNSITLTNGFETTNGCVFTATTATNPCQ
jgi:hypothetical protein